MMTSSQNESPSPDERALKALLDELCTDLGCCLSEEDRNRIATIPNIDAFKFAYEVVKAEGLTPEGFADYLAVIRHRFEKRFGKM